MTQFQLFLLMVVIFAINNRAAVWGYKMAVRRRREKFLRAVVVEYPDARLTFIAVEDSDEEAMTLLEQQIRTNRYHHPRAK